MIASVNRAKLVIKSLKLTTSTGFRFRFGTGPGPEPFCVCEAWLTAIGWKSRTRLVVGSVSRTARMSIAKWNLKEAVGKRSVQRTETIYKADCIG